MIDKKQLADEFGDRATDDPHLAHRGSDRRRWIGFLKHRWPTALALVQAAAVIAVVVLLGADVEFALGIATMAGIYLVAYALGRPAAAWPAYPSLVAVLLALIALGIDVPVGASVGMTVVLVLLWAWAVWGGRARDGRQFAVQTAGMVIFGLLTVVAVLVAPKVGGVLVGVGWIAHGIWDVYHFVENRVVNRP